MTPGCSIEQGSCAVLQLYSLYPQYFEPGNSMYSKHQNLPIPITFHPRHRSCSIEQGKETRSLDELLAVVVFTRHFRSFLKSDLAQTAFSLHVISIQSSVDSVAETPITITAS